MNNQTTTIATVNKSTLTAIATANDTVIPMRPICEALGVNFSSQLKRAKRHPILSSTVVTVTTVGADGKDREMVCLPLEFVYGWLFTIDSTQVALNAREAVINYQRECYHALYNHFTTKLEKSREYDVAEIQALKAISSCKDAISDLKTQEKEWRAKLDKIRLSRLDDQPSLF